MTGGGKRKTSSLSLEPQHSGSPIKGKKVSAVQKREAVLNPIGTISTITRLIETGSAGKR